MASGKDESITIRPIGIAGIELQVPIPERVDKSCGTHRCPWMTRLCFFNGIDGKKSNGIDAAFIKFWIGGVHTITPQMKNESPSKGTIHRNVTL